MNFCRKYFIASHIFFHHILAKFIRIVIHILTWEQLRVNSAQNLTQDDSLLIYPCSSPRKRSLIIAHKSSHGNLCISSLRFV